MSLGACRSLSVFCKTSAVAAIVCLGLHNHSDAAVISYNLSNIKATFRFIPNPPPSQPVFASIDGSFDIDTATNTQSNVKLILGGALVPGDYSFLSPFQPQDNKTIVAAPPRFADSIVIHFLLPLDGTAAVDPIFSVSILSFDPLDPCSPSPTRLACNAFQVTGGAELQSSPTGVTDVPEPGPLAVFGSLALTWGIGRARIIRTTSRPPFAAVMRTLFLAAGMAAGLSANAAVAGSLQPIEPGPLQATLTATAMQLMVPGVLALVRTADREFVLSHGTTQRGDATAPQAATHFRIASNTKTMTSAVILLMVQEGKISPADPVSKYLSGVPDGDRITVDALLKMRSGLYNYTNAPELAESLDRDPGKVWTPAELLALAFSRPASFAPGQAYEYCNTNYVLLGLIAERTDAMPLAAIFERRLFVPFGMAGTSFPASASNRLPDPYAHGYLYHGSSYALVDAPYPADLPEEARAGRIQPNDDTGQNPSYAFAAGGAISTAHDLAVWIRALAGGRVFDAATQRQWLASITPEDPKRPDGQKYGYGIVQIRFGPNTLYFHGGEMPGYNSFMGHDPDNDLTLVVWTNLTLSPDGTPTANRIALQLLDQIYVDSPLAKQP